MPAHTVRVSARAKNVNIRVSVRDGLVVTIPCGFDRRQLPAILVRKLNWIKSAVERMEERRSHLCSGGNSPLPIQIKFLAVEENWQVDYQQGNSARVSCEERNGLLIVKGGIDNPRFCRALLRRWLAHRARKRLVPELRQLSVQMNLPFERSMVRGQKTRWGSCSGLKTISINYKLLFLPPSVVRYVFIHELCHTIYPNHSENFWTMVSTAVPEYKKYVRTLKEAWRYIPGWVEGIEA